ncbi:MAG TPA: hypothetical protein PLA94_25455, partial [Myxococcota bacterium]|nr:hypothetical protein [Myxococcota bacterium]
APLTALAFKIINASGFRDDRPDNYSGVANLCNWILSELPRGAIRTAHFVENMRAMAVGAKPRTMDELAKQLWQQTADALRDGTAAVAKAAGETIKKAKENFDEGAGEGTSTALLVGLGLLGVVGAGAVVWKVAK